MDNIYQEKKSKITVRSLCSVAMLSAIAFVLMYLEIPALLMPSFIKFDVSDLPALIGTFTFGPVAGCLIEIVKNLLHMPQTQTAGVGELSNMLLGIVFVGSAGLIYKKNKTKKNAIFAAVVGAILMAVLSFPINFFVVYPTYYNFVSKDAILASYKIICPLVTDIKQCLLVFNVPFTFVKAMVCVGITICVYKPLAPLLRGNK
ncbi:ECF transporter S component [Lachnobacterium bovis]|uniref:Riboflavin transporter n=1 Tax=Lachnobacterium bovis TaxID=140626 RepID=A0A1H9RNM2_9FIRM|nr:ECF transporter S component [Lachnobacterium bovis]SER74138.1 Riboflavin transporter FmnP [Lachnobacterium bovis]